MNYHARPSLFRPIADFGDTERAISKDRYFISVFSYWLTFGELCPQTDSLIRTPLSGPGYASKRTVGHSSSAAFTLSDGNHYHRPILRCLYA